MPVTAYMEKSEIICIRHGSVHEDVSNGNKEKLKDIQEAFKRCTGDV